MKKLIIYLLTIFIVVKCGDESLLIQPGSIKINPTDSVTVSLKQGESSLINDELTINFESVPSDSRCPIDAICVWTGDAEAKLNLTKNKQMIALALHTTLQPKTTIIDDYEIQLVSVSPSRKAQETIYQNQYRIQLKIKWRSKESTKPIYFINSSSEGVLYKDALTVNNVSIDGSFLNFSVSYSGGCKDHFINLYSYSGILKSNPPQLNLVLSHNANSDMCKAYITKNFLFDLNTVKNYLLQSEITDKVILNIIGTDGNLIKQSPITLKFN